MLDIADLEFFKVVSEAHSLAAAARELKVSAPAVSQRVSLLEKRIGLSLFERKDQKSKLTETGSLLASRGRVILSAMHALTLELEQQKGNNPTPLRVMVPMGPAGRLISRLTLSFLRKHPTIRVQVVRGDQLPSSVLKNDNWDLMVYIGTMLEDPQADLFEQLKLSSMRIWLVASPEYLAKHGTPLYPEDLKFHSCATSQVVPQDGSAASRQPSIEWQLLHMEGQIVHVNVPAQYSSNDISLLQDWCASGMGIIARRGSSALDDIMSGTLVRVLPEWELPKCDVMAVCRKQSLYLSESQQLMKDMKTDLHDRVRYGWENYIFDELTRLS